MNTKHKHIEHKLSILFLVMLIFIGVFLMLGVNFSNFRFLIGLRIPKLFGIILSGICISVSTLIFQTITNSRILTPSVMGLDAMYVFLQTAIFFIFHKFIPILSDDIVKFFLTIVAMVFITSSLQKLFSGNSKGKILYMVLIGMVTGTFLDSLSNSMQVIMDPNEFLILQSSLFASYNTINIYLLIIAYIILGVVIYFIIGEHNQLDVLSLGHDQAINLGLDYNRILKKYLVVISILVSISTALVGPITFLGLLTVNIAKELFSTYKHIYLSIVGIVLNIIFLIFGQLLVEKVFNNSISIGTIINFVGGIYLLNILLKERENSMIEIKGLSKKYRSKYVVKDVTTEFPDGKITCIIGPNGAGKSTLLSMMSRLSVPDEGEVFIDGKSIKEWDKQELSKTLAILKQENNTNIRLTVYELVSFGRFPHSQGKLTVEDIRYIDEAIEYMNLEEFKDKYLDELSGGQRQRAYIAMVIAQNTKYILLDEPLNNLDMKNAVQMMRTFEKMVKDLNKTIIIVMHDINFTSVYSDYILAMKNGRLEHMDSCENIVVKDKLENLYEMEFDITKINNKNICVYF